MYTVNDQELKSICSAWCSVVKYALKSTLRPLTGNLLAEFPRKSEKVVPKLYVTKDDTIFLSGINGAKETRKKSAITETTIKDKIPFVDDNEPCITTR